MDKKMIFPTSEKAKEIKALLHKMGIEANVKIGRGSTKWYYHIYQTQKNFNLNLSFTEKERLKMVEMLRGMNAVNLVNEEFKETDIAIMHTTVIFALTEKS